MKRFPCTKCGACCRRAKLISDFPADLLVNGVCKHYKQMKCDIYADRPDICRISKNQGEMPREEYFRLTAIICNIWATMDGMGDQVDPGQFKGEV